MKLDRRTLLTGLTALTITPAHAQARPLDMTIGAANAPLRLVEYASATCSHCAHFHETNWDLLKSRYIDSGRVRFTLREMATPPAQVAFGMFQLARCGGAGAEEYLQRLAILYQRQRAILQTGTMAGVRDALVALGGEWGLTADQVVASLTDQSGADRLQRSIEEASTRGVTGTPSFFIDDVHVTDMSFLTPDGMTLILDAAL
jgi:protein-disulfide isomerase